MNIMKSRGVETIESLGKIFNPKESESIGEVDVDTEKKDGIVMEEMRRGYKMHGTVIRPSLVKVGKFSK
jgi:molecular chaperone GrpE (heat shock protein)